MPRLSTAVAALLVLFLSAGAAKGETTLVPVVGLKLATPQRASLPVGVVFRQTRQLGRHASEKIAGGVLIQAEPGWNAQKLNLGWAYVSDDPGLPHGSLSLRAAGLWATRDAFGLHKGQAYLGGEVASNWEDLGVSLGLFVHVAGVEAKHPLLLSAAVGCGFP